VKLLRESFAAKVLAALLGTVGLLLIVTYVVVQAETARQVDAVAARAIENAGSLFEELNEFQRQQAALLARPFTETPRARALLDATIQARDYDYLAEQVSYDMQLAGLTDVLLVFTDADGFPVLSMVEGEPRVESDPADIAPLAEALLAGDDLEATAYRLVEGRLYNVTSLYIDQSLRPIGTITFGRPIGTDDVARIGNIGGFEACFHVGGRCVSQTPGVTEGLREVMNAATTTAEPRRARVDDTEYSVLPSLLTPDDPGQGQRIVAVPLDEVLAPFTRIRQALLAGAGGALLLSVLIGAGLSRNLTQPIRSLVAATGRVAEGDYRAEVSVATHDEMRTLADAFNDMTRGLLLRERYRSVLNKVVSQDVAEELMRGDVELGGESRPVSVLFADIRGFTPLTEGMEPQKVIRLLNDCMECLSQAVDAEGGVVDKYIGDEVMAVFGAPVTQPDHARRAVTAAVRMKEGMAAFNASREARGEQPLAIGIGINTGVAVAGNMGSSNRLNYTVVGAIVNLASRLAGQAGPGEILVSGETLEQAGDGVVAPLLGGRSMKGFSQEIEVYAVASVADLTPGPSDTQTAESTPPSRPNGPTRAPAPSAHRA